MTLTPNSTEILATVVPSPGRRWFALAVLMGLGVILVYLGVAVPPESLLLQLFLIGLGAAVIFLCVKMHQATERYLVVTSKGLFDDQGTELALVEDLAAVERGVFAFKPSNGFLIRLQSRKPRAWYPGVWWRLGRKIGIGGATPGHQARMAADILRAMLDERQK